MIFKVLFQQVEQIHRMVPFYGTYGSRQRINNKSIQEEYKIWVLVAEPYGYVVQFRSYQGAKNGKHVASSTKTENVVLWLRECLTPTFSFDIFMDNCFTFFHLLTQLAHLAVNNIPATGVLNKNRL